MKYLFLCVLLISCATAPQTNILSPQLPPLPAQNPKYKVGDCLMIVDLPSGKTESRHRVRIEKITTNSYYYRWLLDDNRWDKGLSNGAGKFEVLEKISKKVYDCPKV